MDSIWTRTRPAASARETLTRPQIVRVAIELLDSEGLAGLSMRKLAAKLDSGATSLYWHVPTKDDLIDLVIDEIYTEVDVPEPGLAGWRAGATLFAHSLRATVLRHAWLPDVIYNRPSIGPNAMSLGSRGLVLFRAAGFDGLDVDFAMSSVMSFVFGSASAEVAVRSTVRKAGQSLEEWTSEVIEMARTNVAGHPEMENSLRLRTDRELNAMTNESFAFGLDALLDGLEAKVKKTESQPRPTRSRE